MPEPDGARRFSLTDHPWYRLLHGQVHERIITILDINQPPGFQRATSSPSPRVLLSQNRQVRPRAPEPPSHGKTGRLAGEVPLPLREHPPASSQASPNSPPGRGKSRLLS